MSTYYIIYVEASRVAGKVMFWHGDKILTPNHEHAMQVNEDYLIANLETLDNGSTTRAVLCTVVINKPGEVKNILIGITGKQENAA